MIVLLFITFIIAFYFYVTRNNDYWLKRNVKHPTPLPLFGTNLLNQLGLKSVVELATDVYNEYPNEKFVGTYRGITPELLIRDLDLVRQILSVDFNSFYGRGVTPRVFSHRNVTKISNLIYDVKEQRRKLNQGKIIRDPKPEFLFRNLFNTDGDSWRLLRQRLTPAFTTAKLRAMFPLIISCANDLQKSIDAGGVLDARDLMARFSTDFIAACGFGIQVNSISNHNNQFRKLGKLIFTRSFRNRLMVPLFEWFPELKTFIRTNNHVLEHEMTALVKNILDQRNNKPIGRNDFVDMLLELKEKGNMKGESIENFNPDGTPVPVEMEMDLKCLVAQIFVFFAAGFETSSSTTSFTLHKLAHHPEIQNKIQQEIDTVIEKHGELCYDSISDMKLLDMAFKESMRMFPALGILTRMCTRRYKIPDTDITLDPGVRICIPVQAIHMDEQYYNNPQEFRPERFNPEAIQNRHKYAYLAFGGGPRVCVGERLGHMQSLAGLAAVLQRFRVEPAPGAPRDLECDHSSLIVQGVRDGIPLKFTLRGAA